MNKYEHITRMEHILNTHTEKIAALNEMLDFIEAHRADYRALIEYYYSDQRNQDLADDEKGLIPESLHRGVLSEDSICDLMTDSYEIGLRMLETAHDIFKNR